MPPRWVLGLGTGRDRGPRQPGPRALAASGASFGVGVPTRLGFGAPGVAPRGIRTTGPLLCAGFTAGSAARAGSARTWAGEARGREGELAGGAGRGAALAQLGAWQWDG